jgi:hypothetical protein
MKEILPFSETPFLNEIMSTFHCGKPILVAFPDFPGNVQKFDFVFNTSPFSIIFYQKNDKIRIKLFDTRFPEAYYQNLKFSKHYASRSNNPCILNFRYRKGKEETWADIQLPFHSGGVGTIIEVVAKLESLLRRVYVGINTSSIA